MPISAMTENLLPKTLEDALSCGMGTRMSKPIDANEVTRMLARLLDSKNARNPR